MLILVINSGSSSIKYQLLDMAGESFVAGGIIERIGGHSRITRKDADGHRWQKKLPLPNHREAFRELLSALEHAGEIRAIGHRVVHGGTRYTSPTRITEDVLALLRSLRPYTTARTFWASAPAWRLSARISHRWRYSTRHFT